MSRRNEPSIAEDALKAASYLPWWACLLLALISFLIFNSISNMPEQPLVVGQAGNYLGREAMKIFAFFAKIVIPSLLVFAGIASGVKKQQGHEPDKGEKKIAYIILGLLALFLIALFLLFSMTARNAGGLLDNLYNTTEMNIKRQQEQWQKEKMARKNEVVHPKIEYKAPKIERYNSLPRNEARTTAKKEKINKWVDHRGVAHFSNVYNTITIEDTKIKPAIMYAARIKNEKKNTGYIVYLKNGRTVRSSMAGSDGSTVRFRTGQIETELPIGEIRGVEELSRTGEETGSQYLDFRAGF